MFSMRLASVQRRLVALVALFPPSRLVVLLLPTKCKMEFFTIDRHSLHVRGQTGVLLKLILQPTIGFIQFPIITH